METILREILIELKFQTKLLESVFHSKDQNTHQQKQAIKSSMAMLEKGIMNMPGMKDNPQVKEMLKNITNIIPGG